MKKSFSLIALFLVSILNACGEPAVHQRTYICQRSGDCPPKQVCVNYFAYGFHSPSKGVLNYVNPVIASREIGLDPAWEGICVDQTDIGPGKINIEICDNGKDDDGDGFSDCEDPQCINLYNEYCKNVGSRNDCAPYDAQQYDIYEVNPGFSSFDLREECSQVDLWDTQNEEWAQIPTVHIKDIVSTVCEGRETGVATICAPGCKNAYLDCTSKSSIYLSYSSVNSFRDGNEWCFGNDFLPVDGTTWGHCDHWQFYNPEPNVKALCTPDGRPDLGPCGDQYNGPNCTPGETACSDHWFGEPAYWLKECMKINGRYMMVPTINCYDDVNASGCEVCYDRRIPCDMAGFLACGDLVNPALPHEDLYECQTLSDGMFWVKIETCDDSSTDVRCIDAGCGVVTTDCNSSSVNTYRCSGNYLELCQDMGGGSYSWSLIEDCSNGGRTCDPISGSCIGCNMGESRCSTVGQDSVANTIMTCNAMGGWEAGEDCGIGGDICFYDETSVACRQSTCGDATFSAYGEWCDVGASTFTCNDFGFGGTSNLGCSPTCDLDFTSCPSPTTSSSANCQIGESQCSRNHSIGSVWYMIGPPGYSMRCQEWNVGTSITYWTLTPCPNGCDESNGECYPFDL